MELCDDDSDLSSVMQNVASINCRTIRFKSVYKNYTKVLCEVILRKLCFILTMEKIEKFKKNLFNVLDVKSVRLGVTVQIYIFK